MKIVVRASVKLDLPVVLQHVIASDHAGSAQLLASTQARFGVKKRAAQDAISVLVSGGWLQRDRGLNDGREVDYAVTAKGNVALDSFAGLRELRLARWRYSTTSTRARRFRLRQRKRCV